MPGTLYVVATPIGNLEDITLRALRVLREVSLIAVEDTRRTAKLLSHYSISTPTTSVHEHNERRRTDALLARLRCGDDVALVSDAGTPTISDPGGHLVAAALGAGFRVVAVPGPSAVLTALVSAGTPTDSFLFAGFAPRRSKARKDWFKDLSTSGRTLVFFETPHRIRESLADAEAVLGNRPIIVLRELTKVHEELVKGPITDVRQRLSEPRGEFTVIVPAVDSSAGVKMDRHSLQLSQEEVFDEFGRLMETGQLSRREAVSKLAAKYGVSQRTIYGEIERAKSSGR
jgi:16S rRNA (cytidine1402-2'-O)-methyltransferase